jgi:hypothetical protein
MMSAETNQLSSLEGVLNGLAEKGMIESKTIPNMLTQTVSSKVEEEIPIYLKLLVSVGAVCSAGFLLFFLVLSKLVGEEPAATAFVGVVLCVVAVFVYRYSQENAGKGTSFPFQFSFCLMLTGRIIATAGFTTLFFGKQTGLGGITILLGVSVIATYKVYPLGMDRFLGFLAFFASLYIFCSNISLTSVVLGVFLLACGLITSVKKIRGKFQSIRYALVYAVSISIVLNGFRLNRIGTDDVFALKFLLIFALIAVIIHAAGGFSKLRGEPIIVAMLSAVVIGMFANIGIIWSLILLILGFAERDKVFTSLGLITLPLFLWFFYYNLHQTLAVKSVTLVGSGVLLILGYLYVSKRVVSILKVTAND